MRLRRKKSIFFYFMLLILTSVSGCKQQKLQETAEMMENFTEKKSEIQKLEIQAGNLEVHLHQGEAFQTTIRYIKGKKPTVRLQKGTLTITVSEEAVGRVDKTPKIDLTIPKNQKLSTINLEDKNGKILAKDVQATTANVQSGNGDIKLENFRGKMLKITDGNGAATLKKISVETLEFKQANGSVVIRQLKTTKKSKLNSINGEISLAQLEVPGLDIKLLNGGVTVKGKSQAGGKYQSGEEKQALKVRVNNGEIDVK